MSWQRIIPIYIVSLSFLTGTMWENWAVLGAIFICVPVLLLLKENYNRLTVDESSKEVNIEVKINDKHTD